MGTKAIFESHPVSNLRKAISKTNIKGYSKMKKSELVALMVKNKERFQDLKPYVKPGSKAPVKKTIKVKKQPAKEAPKQTRKQPSGRPTGPEKGLAIPQELNEDIREELEKKGLKTTYGSNPTPAQQRMNKQVNDYYKKRYSEEQDKFLDQPLIIKNFDTKNIGGDNRNNHALYHLYDDFYDGKKLTQQLIDKQKEETDDIYTRDEQRAKFFKKHKENFFSAFSRRPTKREVQLKTDSKAEFDYVVGRLKSMYGGKGYKP